MMQGRGILMACAGVGVAFAAGLIAAPAISPQPEQPEMDPAMMAWVTPDEHHKALEPLIGEWDGKVTIWLEPGATEPLVSTGTATREWAMDGRFVIEHIKARMPGVAGEYRGMGIIGYNTVENRYETVWIENMATYMTFMEGTLDPEKKVLTFEGEVLDPMTGQRTHSRYVTDMSDPNRHLGFGYATGPDGKEYKNFEGVMEKRR